MAGPRVAHAGRGHMAKGHATTRVHVGAREGHHVARGFADGGPTGIVGPVKKLGAVTQMRYRTPIFKRAEFRIFFRVGLCSHTALTLCRTRGCTVCVGFTGSNWKASIRWTQSPPDHHLQHVR